LNNIINLAAAPLFSALDREGWDLTRLLEEEPDAGLGNGGLPPGGLLHRLAGDAAAFRRWAASSMVTDLPSVGETDIRWRSRRTGCASPTPAGGAPSKEYDIPEEPS
jgi:hypothetical protein